MTLRGGVRAVVRVGESLPEGVLFWTDRLRFCIWGVCLLGYMF